MEIKEFDNPYSDEHLEEERVPSLLIQLAGFLQTNEPALRRWMMEYLEQHRQEIAVRWWTTHVNEWIADQFERFPKKKLHPRVMTEWKGPTPFSVIQDLVETYRAQLDVSYCDVPAILAIHADNGCDDPWYCFMCEETKIRWTQEIKQRVERRLEPFLVLQPMDIPNWSPPHSYRNESYEYLERSDYLIRLTERRVHRYTCEETLRKKIRTLLTHALPYYDYIFDDPFIYSGWSLPYWKPADDYEKFILLWNTVELIRICIRMDMPQILLIKQEIPRRS